MKVKKSLQIKFNADPRDTAGRFELSAGSWSSFCCSSFIAFTAIQREKFNFGSEDMVPSPILQTDKYRIKCKSIESNEHNLTKTM